MTNRRPPLLAEISRTGLPDVLCDIISGYLDDDVVDDLLTYEIPPNCYLKCAKLQKKNLVGADLRNLDLTFAMLDDADCTDANFEGSNLYGVNFVRTNCTGANLKNVNLDSANLIGSISMVRFSLVQTSKTQIQFHQAPSKNIAVQRIIFF